MDEETKKAIEKMLDREIERIPDHIDDLEEIVGFGLRKGGRTRCRNCKEYFHWNELSGELLCKKCVQRNSVKGR